MEIIKANDPDFNKIVTLLELEWPKEEEPPSRDKIIKSFQEHYRPEVDTVWYLVEDEAILGWYRYTRWPREDRNSSNVHLLDIAVSPGHQGRGNGGRLMRHFIEECGALGYEMLWSRTALSNQASIALHRGAGFEEFERHSKALVWRMRLKAKASDSSG